MYTICMSVCVCVTGCAVHPQFSLYWVGDGTKGGLAQVDTGVRVCFGIWYA